eukprot:TRINITY_DN5570_c0_g1_i1.p1 TRINITY_DN5570_c0_g1~~TRINITY_DN5570_c0_g1_i1.p1  ORF type:complete len:350 (+),score=22.75 TRINITY_DN5570_c0_g1_i1:198-1247(+)
MAYVSKQEFRDFLKIVFICIGWYIVSSTNGVLGKMILSQFPYPMTVTMVHLASIAIFSTPMLKMLQIRQHESTWTHHKSILLPLAFGKFVSSVFSHISLWKVPVSYAHTVKASMPIFTVLISRFLLGERHSTSLYFSLMPIVFGVAIATVTELSFDVVGLGSALVATAGFSLMNIFSKRAMKETGMHHLRLLHKLGQISALMFLPVWTLVDLTSFRRDLSVEVVTLLLVDGTLHWIQNILAFTLLKLVVPLTYAVANVTKRISVITVSLLLLKNPVTLTNVGGMMLAIGGVFCYNMAKYRENQAKDRLPTSLNRPVTSKPLWQDHYTFDHKVQVTTPLSFLDGQMKRNQ